ncbi:NPCBM/NEW2 domain-containing protein [Candidatus Roizmanbacteria bacterium]|nr:NPCBM/NEW2 domain-containing protein [Candidatus Roizmanbacteria bacterium]
MFYLFLLFGLLIRLALVPLPGFKADVAFWKGWGLAVADKGIVWLINNTNYNYPPGFAYVLWLINKVYALFKNPYNINEYWADNNLFYLFLLKLITIAADLLIVWLIIKFSEFILNPFQDPKEMPKQVRHDKLGKVFALFYFLNPAVIYDGVVWGQVDQFGLALFLLSVYFILNNRPNWATVIFTVSCLMKFQNIIFIPLFYLYIFRRFGIKVIGKSLAVTLLTFLIVIFPFFLAKQMERVIWLLTVNSDWFPWYSLNAFNGWWIASGLNGMGLIDKHLVFGITSAKQFGLLLFTFAYFISTVSVLFAKKEELFKNFILACSLATFSFFHLLTQSHERYLFPVMGLILLLGFYYLRKDYETRQKMEDGRWKMEFIYFSIFYLLTSIFFFLNMYLSMGWNYPDQVIPALTKDQTLGLSFYISVIQIILFAIFFYWYLKVVGRPANRLRVVGAVGGFAILIIIVLLGKNMSYFLGKPVSLTLMKPVGYHQDYLEPAYNKTVESGRGVKFWNRLSVNYFFYDKGIGSHADSEITYDLAKKFSAFSSDFGLDTEADQSAKVYFSILADGKELFKSEVKGRFDLPGSTKVNVKGVKYLTLKISKAGESNFGAHADWLDPVVIR